LKNIKSNNSHHLSWKRYSGIDFNGRGIKLEFVHDINVIRKKRKSTTLSLVQ
jgi:hypothetical protein